MKSKTPLPKKPVLAKAKDHRQVVDTLPIWTPFAVMLFTFLLYSKALVNGLTNFDDDFYIINNPYLKDFSWNGVNAIFSSFYQGNYHPFTTMIYFFFYNWFGLNPLPYHLLNVMLHVFNVLLVFKLAEQLSGKQITALIVAILFAVHPLHVESVAWISELKDVLYSSFFLLSLLAYLRYMKSGMQIRDYWMSLAFFLASLFSKSAAVTLPFILITIDFYKGRKFNSKSFIEKIPFIVLAMLFGVLTILSQKTQGSINIQMLTFNPITRFFFLTSALSFYFIKFIFPFRLSAMNYYPILNKGILPWQYYASIVLILFIVWFVLRKSALRREIIFGVCFFLIAISVMLQIVSVGSALTAERYTYISYIGLFYIVGQWVSSLGNGQKKNLVIGLLSLFVLVFSVQTFARISVWQNGYTIDEDIIEHNPDVYIGYWMRGNLKRTQEDYQGALQDYSKAIKLDPFNDDSYYNRGNIYDRLGDPKAAINDYDKAIQYNPKLADSYNNRGWAYYETGDSKAALDDISKAISMAPRYVQAYNNRGWINFKAKNYYAALPDFNKAIEIQPEYLTAYYNRAMLDVEMKDYNGAISDYNTLSKFRPKDSNIFYNMGIVYMEMKDTANACKEFSYSVSMGNKNANQMASQYCH